MRLKEMLEQLWKSYRGSLILLGVLLVLNLLLFTALQQFIAPRVAEQESRFLQEQAEVRQLLHKQGATAKSPEQLYVLATQDLAKFQQAVPDYQEFTALIEELLVLSSRANLNITQISYRSEELPENLLLKFDLNFNVAGDYKQIKKFIHSLEQSVRLIAIKQISLQSADNDGVSLRLSLETFFRPGSRES
jgi:type IV pilus assembly protein PilO